MSLDLIVKIAIVVTGCYEVIARVWPSVKDWTILGNIINLLKAISDAFNRLK